MFLRAKDHNHYLTETDFKVKIKLVLKRKAIGIRDFGRCEWKCNHNPQISEKNINRLVVGMSTF